MELSRLSNADCLSRCTRPWCQVTSSKRHPGSSGGAARTTQSSRHWVVLDKHRNQLVSSVRLDFGFRRRRRGAALGGWPKPRCDQPSRCALARPRARARRHVPYRAAPRAASQPVQARRGSRATARGHRKLVDREAVLDKLVHTAANPVQDDLVDRVHHWPGVNGLSARWQRSWLQRAPCSRARCFRISST